MPPLEPKTPLTPRIRTKPEVSSSISLARPLARRAFIRTLPTRKGLAPLVQVFPNFAEVAHAPTVHIFQLVVSIRRAPDKSPETNFKFQLARDSGSGKSKAKLTPLLRFTNPGASKTRHVRIMRTQNPETTFCHCFRVRVDRKMSTTRIS